MVWVLTLHLIEWLKQVLKDKVFLTPFLHNIPPETFDSYEYIFFVQLIIDYQLDPRPSDWLFFCCFCNKTWSQYRGSQPFGFKKSLFLAELVPNGHGNHVKYMIQIIRLKISCVQMCNQKFIYWSASAWPFNVERKFIFFSPKNCISYCHSFFSRN